MMLEWALNFRQNAQEPDRWRPLLLRPDHHARTVPGWCYAQGMTDYFYAHQLRIFDYPQWAQPLREAIRKNMERLAAENDIEIEFVRSKTGFAEETTGQADSGETRQA